MLERMRGPWILPVSCVFAGLLLGRLMSSLPTPTTLTAFWIGNLSSPWAVLAFVAGWSQRSRTRAVAAGVITEVGCVVGFYGQFLVGDFVDPRRLGFFGSTDALTLVATAVSQWLWFIGPWMVVAIGAGVVYGLLGRWWRESRSIVAGVALALPFVVEPVAWRVYVGFAQGPMALWLVEVAVGLTILAWVIAGRRALGNSGSFRRS
jgi:hypothetical protein